MAKTLFNRKRGMVSESFFVLSHVHLTLTIHPCQIGSLRYLLSDLGELEGVAEGVKLKSACELLKALGEIKIAEEYDTTTGAALNELISLVEKVVDGKIDVKNVAETDTTTFEDLNKLIAAVKNSLDGIEVEEIKVDWDNVDLDNYPPKTGPTINSLFAAIVEAVRKEFC